MPTKGLREFFIVVRVVIKNFRHLINPRCPTQSIQKWVVAQERSATSLSLFWE